MLKPMLQIALDYTDIPSALAIVNKIKDHVDILEAGTLLVVSTGVQAVKMLRAVAPEKTIVCDLKAADAGEILASLAFGAGCTWMTVVCAAPLPTMLSAKKIADKYNGEIQIELFGNWTLSDAKAWYQNGIKQAIYHRGRDAQAAGQGWSKQDLDKMKALSDIGIELSITGGINPDDLEIFKEINTKVFIAGRGIAAAPDPVQACRRFKENIDKIWG